MEIHTHINIRILININKWGLCSNETQTKIILKKSAGHTFGRASMSSDARLFLMLKIILYCNKWKTEKEQIMMWVLNSEIYNIDNCIKET